MKEFQAVKKDFNLIGDIDYAVIAAKQRLSHREQSLTRYNQSIGRSKRELSRVPILSILKKERLSNRFTFFGLRHIINRLRRFTYVPWLKDFSIFVGSKRSL